MSFKPKLLSRSRSGRVACVDSSASPTSNAKTHIEAEEPISNAMEKFLNNASCVVANVFSEAASMAHDMHTIITTDIDEAIVTTTTDIDEVSVGSAQDDKEGAADQPARRTIKEKMKDNLPSTITFFSKPMKESRVYCETRDFFAKPMKDETREDETETETETEAHTETNAGQPTCSRTEAEVEVEVKGSPSPPAAAAAAEVEVEVEVKGSPATLAKLMKKHDKKTKQIEKLKQQLKKTEQEEVETKKRIRALAEKFRCVLNDSINGDADDQNQNQTHDDETQHRDKTHDGKNQTHDDKSENVKSEDYRSDDYQTEDDESESEWEDEERDHDAIDLALWLVGKSP